MPKVSFKLLTSLLQYAILYNREREREASGSKLGVCDEKLKRESESEMHGTRMERRFDLQQVI